MSLATTHHPNQKGTKFIFYTPRSCTVYGNAYTIKSWQKLNSANHPYLCKGLK
ncbi:hypothetical protein THERMOS_465 [Bathymodiolus thermophilus thioautotrophic gill symbiont]|uniref:Uncharacterized protein n=1 Tax=Bathymodiolus thermophilus thioautotrophic gill symbiont TaxID=2360 RepID=A0A8H9CFF2_9GAMM|nr:hypothetical protein THERMOS_465 [Bathymodiolus thermophilus thioautotrophic gill symbiont]